MMCVGNITDAVGVRDHSTGGLYYYSDAETMDDKGAIHVVSPSEVGNYQRGETMINGHYVWDNGLILPGVKEDGTRMTSLLPKWKRTSICMAGEQVQA